MRLDDRLGKDYVPYACGVRTFIDFARASADSRGYIKCPCRGCKNLCAIGLDEVERHIFVNGMDLGYTRWVLHGEPYEGSADVLVDHHNYLRHMDDDYEHDEMEEMLGDIGAGMFMDEVNDNASTGGSGTDCENFPSLWEDAKRELYPGCTKHSKMSFIVRLLHIKSLCGMSTKAINMVLDLFNEVLPEGSALPKNFYEAKQLRKGLGFEYKSIHACKNDCVLFWKENEEKQACPVCGESRWKGKKNVPVKVLRYFPLKPRLQRLYMCKKTAHDMRWHEEKRVKNDGYMRHPADSLAWQSFDNQYPEFGLEARNVRLGLTTDGFNPFGNMSTSYSTWPVVLIPYNLPPWRCMKAPNFLLTLLIPGPRSPGNDIDVFMQPLIEELKELWETGVRTYDASKSTSFQMHAAVMWTINDFPAYGNLSGWSTKGKLACPTCNKETASEWLKFSQKLCFMGHRRYLPANHAWRRECAKFDGRVEDRIAPKELSGEEIVEQLEHVRANNFGKGRGKNKRKRAVPELNWTKRSIFFDLPYWSSCKLRHSLDVMHIEKNICDNILGTLMSINKKTKDTIKTRKDLERMRIKHNLHLRVEGNRVVMPHACFTMTREERMDFCKWLQGVKLPDGYASNIGRCVSPDDWKINGLKSHDCHVFLQKLLPVGIRGKLTSNVRVAISELCMFFKDLCARVVNRDVLSKLEEDIATILCKFEQIFPPSFFDVMVHLAIHLPREVLLGGPVQFRWMYPVERYLGRLKRTVGNKAKAEGSIAEAYIHDEWLTFCSLYLRGVETRFNRQERNADLATPPPRELSVFSQNVRPLGAQTGYDLIDGELGKVRWYVLNNCREIDDYLRYVISFL